MARRKKTTRKRTGKKKTVFLYGIVVFVVGLLLGIVAVAPGSMGAFGRFVDQKFLEVAFGRAPILPGIYCMGVGLALLAGRKKLKLVIGLTCLFISALVIADALLSTTQATTTGSDLKQGVPIGNYLRSTAIGVIGSAGLVLLTLAILLCGVSY